MSTSDTELLRRLVEHLHEVLVSLSGTSEDLSRFETRYRRAPDLDSGFSESLVIASQLISSKDFRLSCSVECVLDLESVVGEPLIEATRVAHGRMKEELLKRLSAEHPSNKGQSKANPPNKPPMHPWLVIKEDYLQAHPDATLRQIAAEIFRRLDRREQRERLAEFENTTLYSGKTYRNPREAAVAKIKRQLERPPKSWNAAQ